VKSACIARHQGAFDVRLMCRVLGVSSAGFYAAAQQRRGDRPVSARTRANQRLLLAIRGVHTASRQRYGAPSWQDPHRYGEIWDMPGNTVGLFVGGRGAWVIETHEMTRLPEGPPGAISMK